MTDRGRPLPPGWRPLGGARPGPRPVGESVERLAAHLGAPAVDGLRVVFGQWAEVVGETVASHARPVSLVDGVLTVVVTDPGWATELRFLGPELVTQLCEHAGEGVVSAIEVRVEGAGKRRR